MENKEHKKHKVSREQQEIEKLSLEKSALTDKVLSLEDLNKKRQTSLNTMVRHL